MTFAKLKENAILVVMSVLIFLSIVGSYVEERHIYDLLYIIFIVIYAIRYIIACKND